MDAERLAPETRRSSAWDHGGAADIAVLVPTYDRERFLRELVAALEGQLMPTERFEVVIVDNGSRDETWTTLSKLIAATPLRMLAARVEPNRGPAVARNLAASLSRAPAIAFTDDDCLPSPGWIEALAAELAAGADLVQGPTLPEPHGAARSGPWDRTIRVEDPSPLFETCNIAYRRAVFDEAGGFAEGLVERQHRMPFGEDVELGWRVRTSGGTTTFAPAAIVHHRVHAGGYRAWLDEQKRLGLFPTLVARNPGLASALWGGVFLTPKTAAADLAAAATLATVLARQPLLLLGTVPWIAARWRDARARPGRPAPVRLAQLAVGDAVGLAALLKGSVRARRLVV
jgi:GT2 family glycosyltransferase